MGQNPEVFGVAVSPFSTQGFPSDYDWLGRSFTDALIGRLYESGQVRVAEREYLEKLINEMAFMKSGLVDEKTAVNMGRLLGVKFFVFGSVSLVGNSVVCRARVISVERGEVAGVCEATGGKDQLLRVQSDVGRKITQALALEKAFTEKASVVPSIKATVLMDLERLRQMCRSMPQVGLDPARKRRESEYYFALTLSEKILKEAPALGEVYLYRGIIELQLGDYDKAETDIQTAKSLSASGIDCDLALANVYFLRRDFTEAERLLRRSIWANRSEARAWYVLGRTLMEEGRYLGASEAFLRACEENPFIADAEANLRVILTDPVRSGKLIRALEERKPGVHSAARLFLGFWENNVKGVHEYIPFALASHPSLYMAHYMAGLYDLTRKQKKSAHRHFVTCLSLNSSFPEVHRELGLLELETNRIHEGKHHLDIYLNTADYIDDYDRIEKALAKHKG